MLYVIGFNLHGELGQQQQPQQTQVDVLTNWSNSHSNLCLKDINNAYEHTIFTTETNEYFMSNNKLKLNDLKLKIKKIYTSVGGCQKTFFITDKDKIYQLELDNDSRTITAIEIKDLQNVIAIKGGTYHNIALCGSLLNDDKILCIIENMSLNMCIPNAISGIIIEYYDNKTRVYSTGQADYGQNGHGSNSNDTTNWNIIDSLTDKSIIKISCGCYHTMFLSETGVIYACGYNGSGQLGFGSHKTDRSLPPQPINLFVRFKIIIIEIQSGSFHNLCIDNKHKIYSFGANKYGQCGHGTTQNITTPKMIQHLLQYNITSIKCGYYHSYAQTDTQNHYLFGDNEYNQCCLRRSNKKEQLVPLHINPIFTHITQGQIIKDVFLGNKNTFIISHNI